MTIAPETDWRAAARADKAAEREQARADRAARDQARLDREELQQRTALEGARLEAEQRRADQAAEREQQRKDDEERRRREAADRRQREQEQQRRREQRAGRQAQRRAWLKANAALPFVVLVMVCSVVPAVLSQVGALTGAGVEVALAALLAVMLEGAAWAITFMGKAAESRGASPKKYRIGTWVAASLAAVVNFLHGLQQYAAHPWVAVVLAASSLLAVWVWDLYTHHSAGRTKAEKKADAKRAAHAKARRKLHPDVVALADSIRAAAHFGTVTEDHAFERAWLALYGTTDLGTTPEIRGKAVQSALAFTAAHDVVEEPAEVGLRARLLDSVYTSPVPLPVLGEMSPLPARGAKKPQHNAQIPPVSEKPAKASPKPPVRRKGDSAPFHPAARSAARQTALAAVREA